MCLLKLKLPYLIFALILCIHTSYAQMTVNSGFTPLEYVQELVGPGITVSNVVMTNNSANQIGIFDGQKRPHVGPVSMQIHVPLINKKTGQIISITGSDIQVMDSETFETIDIELIDEEVEGKLEQGQDIEYWDVMGRTKIMRIKTS